MDLNWIIANWDDIFTVIGIVAAIACPVVIPYVAVLRKGGRELVELIDKSPTKNRTMKALAEKEGLNAAFKAIRKLPV